MGNTRQASNERNGRERQSYNLDEDDTLREVGEDHDFEMDDEVDAAERRHDPLRQPR
jgi:hypothetical protein